MNLSICISTCRRQPELQWFWDSLRPQIRSDDHIEIIVVDLYAEKAEQCGWFFRTPPKPNIWQGGHRITRYNWWAVCNARNTFLCLARHPYICMVDDRCVVTPDFLTAIREAQRDSIIMAGSYEKRHGMTVENGVIMHGGIIDGKDSRAEYSGGKQMACGGEWLFGCCVAMPLETALSVNGMPERCDSMSFEDVIFGIILNNNKFPVRFDPRAKIIEDRTPAQLGEHVLRTAKERFPNDTSDKAHTTLKWVKTAMRSDNEFEIRDLRAKIQAGGEFPAVDKNRKYLDWFDQQPVEDF